MKTKFTTFLALVLTPLSWRHARASTIEYSSTAGGQYNSVGPFNESPQFIGDKFTVTNSGWLETIATPLSSISFHNTPAKGKITIWSDNGGLIGDIIFSAPVSTTNPPSNSQGTLPPFTVASPVPHTVFLTAGVNYWLTFSETDGSNDLTGYSAVFLSSLGTVFFDQSGIRYATGLQPFVATITLNSDPFDSTAPTNLVSLSAVALLQSAAGSIGSSISAPTHYVVNTKRILTWLAMDEYQAGVYAHSNFPAGAQLAIIGSGFEVVDKNKKAILDVSNILTSRFGTNNIVEEKGAISGGVQAKSQTRRRIFFMNYDDSNINGGVGVNFSLSGLMTSTATTKPAKGTDSVKLTADKLSSATGEGHLQGIPFVITGSFSAGGSSTSSN